MLRKYDGCIGRRHTSASEVLKQVRYIDRRGCAQARPGVHLPGYIYARRRAGSWELDTRVGELQAAS